jgi:hypothetical protein
MHDVIRHTCIATGSSGQSEDRTSQLPLNRVLTTHLAPIIRGIVLLLSGNHRKSHSIFKSSPYLNNVSEVKNVSRISESLWTCQVLLVCHSFAHPCDDPNLRQCHLVWWVCCLLRVTQVCCREAGVPFSDKNMTLNPSTAGYIYYL